MQTEKTICPLCGNEVKITDLAHFHYSESEPFEVYHEKCYEEAESELHALVDNTDLQMFVSRNLNNKT